jgi:hypothetical protein
MKTTISKENIISKIKENYQKHKDEYQEAVKLYKIEADKQLRQQLDDLFTGSIKIHLDLVEPIDNSRHYENLIKMFELEENEKLLLNHNEFEEYILDETEEINKIKKTNSTYKVCTT